MTCVAWTRVGATALASAALAVLWSALKGQNEGYGGVLVLSVALVVVSYIALFHTCSSATAGVQTQGNGDAAQLKKQHYDDQQPQQHHFQPNAEARCSSQCAGCQGCGTGQRPRPDVGLTTPLLQHGAGDAGVGARRQQEQQQKQQCGCAGGACGCGPQCGCGCVAAEAAAAAAGGWDSAVSDCAPPSSGTGTKATEPQLDAATARGVLMAGPSAALASAPAHRHGGGDHGDAPGGASSARTGPIAALQLAQQMLQQVRRQGPSAGAASPLMMACGSAAPHAAELSLPAQCQVQAQAQARPTAGAPPTRATPGEYRGWCRSLNVSVKVSNHAGSFEAYSTRLVSVAPRLVGHAMAAVPQASGARAGAAGGSACGSGAQPPRMGKGSLALVRAACVRGCTLLLTWSRVLVDQPAGGAAAAAGGGGAAFMAAPGGAAAGRPQQQQQQQQQQQIPGAPQQQLAVAEPAAGAAAAAQPEAAVAGTGPAADAPAMLLSLSSAGPPSAGAVQAQVGSTLVRWARRTDPEQHRGISMSTSAAEPGTAASTMHGAGSGLEGGGSAARLEADEDAGRAGTPEMLPVREVVRLVHVSPPALALPATTMDAADNAAGQAGRAAGAATAPPPPAVVRLCVVSAGPLQARVLVLAAAATATAAAEVRADGAEPAGTGMITAAVLKEVPVTLRSGVQDIELDLADVVQGLAAESVVTRPAVPGVGGCALGAYSLQLVLSAPQHSDMEEEQQQQQQQQRAEAPAVAAAAAPEGVGASVKASPRARQVQQGHMRVPGPHLAVHSPQSMHPGAGASARAAVDVGVAAAAVAEAGGSGLTTGTRDGWAGALAEAQHSSEWAAAASGEDDEGSDMGLPFEDGAGDEVDELHAHAHALLAQLPSESDGLRLPPPAHTEPGSRQLDGCGVPPQAQPAPTMAARTASGARVAVRGGASSPAAASSAESSQAATSALLSAQQVGEAATADAGAAQPLVHFFAPLLLLPADAAAEVHHLWAAFSGAAAAPLGELQDAVHAAAADIAELLVDASAEAFARRLGASRGSGLGLRSSGGGGLLGTNGSGFSLASSSERSEDDGGAGGSWRTGAHRRLAPHLEVGRPGPAQAAAAAAAAAAVAAGAAAGEVELGGVELRAAALGEAWTTDMEPLVEDIAALLELTATAPPPPQRPSPLELAPLALGLARASGNASGNASSGGGMAAPARLSAPERRLAEGLAASLLPHLRSMDMPATTAVVTTAAAHVLGQQAVDALLDLTAAPAQSGLPLVRAAAATAAAAVEGTAEAPAAPEEREGTARTSAAVYQHTDTGLDVGAEQAADASCSDVKRAGPKLLPQPQQLLPLQQQLLQCVADDFRVWRVAELLRGAGGRARMCLLIGLAASVQSFATIARGEESAMKLALLALFSLAEVLGNLCISIGAALLLKPRPLAKPRAGPAAAEAAAATSGATTSAGSGVVARGFRSRDSSGGGGGSSVSDASGELAEEEQARRRAALQLLATVYDWSTLVGIPLLLLLCAAIIHFGWIRPFDHFTGPSRLLAIILYRGMWQPYSHPVLLRHAVCITVVLAFLDIVIYRYMCPVAWPMGILTATAVTRVLFCVTSAALEWRARRRFWALRSAQAQTHTHAAKAA